MFWSDELTLRGPRHRHRAIWPVLPIFAITAAYSGIASIDAVDTTAIDISEVSLLWPTPPLANRYNGPPTLLLAIQGPSSSFD
jgi:hypothetical protein